MFDILIIIQLIWLILLFSSLLFTFLIVAGILSYKVGVLHELGDLEGQFLIFVATSLLIVLIGIFYLAHYITVHLI